MLGHIGDGCDQCQQLTVVMSGAGACQGAAVHRAAITSRTRRRLDQEKVKCMQRYETREQRVLKTLNYCLTALEQLEGWAVFAIFPTDEIHTGDRYFHQKIAYISVANYKQLFPVVHSIRIVPVCAGLLITPGRFPQIFSLYSVRKLEFPVAV